MGTWLTLIDEPANSVTHGAGLVLALVAAPVLLTRAYRHGDASFMTGVGLFVGSIIALYFSSTLFHALPAGSGKHTFQLVEHSAIYMLIAGTYTPFTLGVLRARFTLALLCIVWSLAIFGIVLKFLHVLDNAPVSTIVYLAMGWLSLVLLPTLIKSIPRQGLLWILAGGIAYSLGVVFYVIDDGLPFGHTIWHLFVIAGTACHCVAVYAYGFQGHQRHDRGTDDTD